MRICKTCVIPETFPGIKFNEDGICNYCERYKGSEKQEQLKERYKQKFMSILEETRNIGPYDVLMAHSGGKDSTYTLKLLREDFGLKILAITFDHGFVSPRAVENIHTVTDTLDIDHINVRPGAKPLRDVFVKSMGSDIYPIKALERASSICNSCMNLVKSFLLKSAIEMKVPLVAYGWSPGQAPVQSAVFKTNAQMIRQMQKTVKNIFEKITGDKFSAFFLEDHHFDGDRFPCLIHPLAFFEYDEENILKEIQTIGWVNPKDTDANSTNCLLNSFANQVHIEQYGFHPYAFEIAGLVREGCMTREEGLQRLSAEPDPKIIEYVKEKLGLDNDV